MEKACSCACTHVRCKYMTLTHIYILVCVCLGWGERRDEGCARNNQWDASLSVCVSTCLT